MNLGWLVVGLGVPLSPGLRRNQRGARLWGIAIGWWAFGLITFPVEEISKQ